LIDGLMPEGNTSDVSLLPFDSDTIEAGADSKMSMDIMPSDAPVDSALLQFRGASKYVKVKSKSFGGAPPSAAMSSRHVTLPFAVNDSVCAGLCDTTYELKVTEAVTLPKGRISKHGTTSLILDCRKTGDHKACGKANAGPRPKVPAADRDAGGTGEGIACGMGGSCDPTNLGEETCTSLGYLMGGMLLCDAKTCTFDVSMCLGSGSNTGTGGTVAATGGTGGSTAGAGGTGGTTADAGAP
jgi:hypothetical protein